MFITEAEVFQFCLDFIQPQTVGKRRIDVKRFTRNLILLAGRLGLKGAHVVQTVAYLDEDNTNIIAHRKQQFLEVLSLCRSLFAKDTTGNLCQSVHYLCNLRTKDILHIFNRIVGIFNNIVQQGCTDARCTQSHFLAGNLCNGNRVHDIRFTRQAAHALVCLSCEVECLGYDVNLLSVT